MAKLPKGVTTALLLQLGGFTLKNIPGFNKETLKFQVENGNLYIYESDLPSFLERVEKEGLDKNAFAQLLIEVGAVIEGERPAFGGKRAEGVSTRINSRERAEQVVTSTEPGAIEKFMEIMTEMLRLAQEGNTLIKGKAQISLATKTQASILENEKPKL